MQERYPFYSDESSTQSGPRVTSEMSFVSDRLLKDITNLPRQSIVSFAYQSSDRDHDKIGIETAQFTRNGSERARFADNAHQNQELQQSLLIEQSQTSELQHFCRQLLQEIDFLKSKQGPQTDQLLDGRIQNYQMQIQEMKEEIKRLGSFQEQFDENALKIVIERKDQEIMNLKRTLVSIESECCRYKTEMETLIHQYDGLKVRSDTQSQELVTYRQNCQLLSDEKRISSKQLGDMEYRVNLLLTENDKLNKLLKDRITQVERLKAYIDSHEEDHHTKMMAMQQKYDALVQEKLNTFQKERQSIEQNHTYVMQYNKTECQRQIQILSNQNNQMAAQITEYKKKFEDIQQHQKHIQEELTNERNELIRERKEIEQCYEDLKQQKQALEEQVDTFRQRAGAQQNEIESLQSELDALKRREMNRSTVQLNIQRKESDLQELNNRLEEQHAQAQDLQQLKLQIEEKDDLIAYLQENLQEIHMQINSSKQEREQLRQQNNILKQQVACNQNKMADFVEASERQHNKLMGVISELQRRLTEAEDSQRQNFDQPRSPTFVMKDQHSLFPSTNSRKSGHTSLQRLKQYSLSPIQPKTYTEQFRKQLEYRQQQHDSFVGNRSVSCLELVRRQLTNSAEGEETLDNEQEYDF